MIPVLSDGSTYDAILVVGFGGPERREDVMPFLENVLRGRNVPRERMLEVAEHYDHFGGVSPINGQVRDADRRPPARAATGTASTCRSTGATATGTRCSPTPCGRWPATASGRPWRSSWRRTARIRAAASIARTSSAPGRPSARARPAVDKMRVFYNHPDFIAANADRVREALEQVPADRRDAGPPGLHGAQHPERRWPRTAATTSSSPRPAGWSPRPSASGPTAGGSSIRAGAAGRPTPGSSPTSSTTCATLKERGVARRRRPPGRLPVRPHGGALRPRRRGAGEPATRLGLNMVRAGTVGTHPAFVAMLRELIEERVARPVRPPRDRPVRPEPRRLPRRLLPTPGRAAATPRCHVTQLTLWDAHS